MNIEEIIDVANELGVTFDSFSLEDLITGINIEYEHGSVNPATNVTNNDLKMTMKIALAHLYEYPNYYNKYYGLPMFEKKLLEFKKNY